MSSLGALTLMLVTAAVLSFVNSRVLRLPSGIGVTLLVLAGSLALLAAGAVGLPVRVFAAEVMRRLDFQALVLDVMLAFLLFAGSLELALNVDELRAQRWSIGVLATAGVVASTFLVGGLTWLTCRWLHVSLTAPECFLFGALISPTDPVAVLALLRSSKVPKPIEVQMAGEALFNDGIGVVMFSVILGLMGAASVTTVGSVTLLLARQVLGSLALGALAGGLVVAMLRSIDEHKVEVMLTVGLAAGLYGLATKLHTSGPLAVVAAGLVVGGAGRAHAMSSRTRQHLDAFWEIIDEILNVTLFLLIGLQILVTSLSAKLAVVGVVASVLVLLARLSSVGASALALKRLRVFPPRAVTILTWGGLRGGLSLAMALSVGPTVRDRETIQAITYVVVLLSIVAQGLTFGRLLRLGASAPPGTS
jgi:CPA1 family monovalent cation:H+ antiporter